MAEGTKGNAGMACSMQIDRIFVGTWGLLKVYLYVLGFGLMEGDLTREIYPKWWSRHECFLSVARATRSQF